jgi:hypothetical protein
MDCSDSQSVNVSNTSNDQTKRRFFNFVSMAAYNMTSYLSLIGIIMQERPSKKPNIRIIQLNFFRKIEGIFSEKKYQVE